MNFLAGRSKNLLHVVFCGLFLLSILVTEIQSQTVTVTNCVLDPVSKIEVADVVYGLQVSPSEKIVALGTYREGITLVDISDVANPTILSLLPLTLKTGGPAETYNLVFTSDGNTLFVCGAPQLFVINVTDPSNPSIILTSEETTYCYNLAISEDNKFLYVSDWDSAFGLKVFDVSDVANGITLVKKIQTNGNTFQAIICSFEKDKMFTASDVAGMIVIENVDNPANSTVISSVAPALSTKTNTFSFSADGRRTIVGLDRNVFQYVNTQNLLAPFVISEIAYDDASGGALYFTTFGNPDDTIIFFAFDVGAEAPGVQVFQRDSNSDAIRFLNGLRFGESTFDIKFIQNKTMLLLGGTKSFTIVKNCLSLTDFEKPIDVDNRLAIGLGVGLGAGVPLIAVGILVGLLYVRKQQRTVKRYREMGLVNVIQTSKQLSEIKIERELREGHFGKIYLGSWQGTTTVVLKKLKQELKEEFEYEVKVMSMLNHPHVVQFLGIFTETVDSVASVFMVMEFLTQGSLDMFVLTEKKNLQVLDLLTMAKHAAAGLKYLESQQIVHRDIALRNLLVTIQGKGKFIVKVADFGMARILPSEGFLILKEKNVPVRWCAPEVLREARYSTKSDVYSFGILLWELFSFADIPWGKLDNTTVKERVLEGETIQPLDNMPIGVVKLMNACLDKLERRLIFEGVYTQVHSLALEYMEEAEKGGDFHQSIFATGVSALNSLANTGADVDPNKPKIDTHYAQIEDQPYHKESPEVDKKKVELTKAPSGFYSATD